MRLRGRWKPGGGTASRPLGSGCSWPDGPPTTPDWAALALLGVGSIVFLAVAVVVFKRLEPNFAKVL